MDPGDRIWIPFLLAVAFFFWLYEGPALIWRKQLTLTHTLRRWFGLDGSKGSLTLRRWLFLICFGGGGLLFFLWFVLHLLGLEGF